MSAKKIWGIILIIVGVLVIIWGGLVLLSIHDQSAQIQGLDRMMGHNSFSALTKDSVSSGYMKGGIMVIAGIIASVVGTIFLKNTESKTQ